jgi:hypothetical protein
MSESETFDTFVDWRVETFCKEHKEALDPDLITVGLIREAYIRGIKDSILPLNKIFMSLT